MKKFILIITTVLVSCSQGVSVDNGEWSGTINANSEESKIVEKLGVGFLPVEVSVEKHASTKKEITKLGCTAELRVEDSSLPFVTDNHNYIYDCKFENGIENPREMNRELLEIDGVIDTGLFIDMASKVIIGTLNGTKIIE